MDAGSEEIAEGLMAHVVGVIAASWLSFIFPVLLGRFLGLGSLCACSFSRSSLRVIGCICVWFGALTFLWLAIALILFSIFMRLRISVFLRCVIFAGFRLFLVLVSS